MSSHSPSPPAPLAHILETAVYAKDFVASLTFYTDTLRITPHFSTPTFAALPLGQTMLILFARGSTEKGSHLPDGRGYIPPHGKGDREQQQHVAFAVGSHEELEAWERWLRDRGVSIEGETKWPKGARSLYFRDPDDHLLEIVCRGIWPNW